MAATVWDGIGLYAVVELRFDITVTVIAKTQERNNQSCHRAGRHGQQASLGCFIHSLNSYMTPTKLIAGTSRPPHPPPGDTQHMSHWSTS